MALLEINDLIVLYGEIEALRGVTISVDEGKVVTLLGANGAGKSTTLRAISGLAKPAAGEILFDGKSIAGLGPEAIVRLGISHVPEGRRVFPGLTVKENIMLGGRTERSRPRNCRARPTRCSTCFRTSAPLPMRWAGPCRAGSCRWLRWRAA